MTGHAIMQGVPGQNCWVTCIRRYVMPILELQPSRVRVWPMPASNPQPFACTHVEATTVTLKGLECWRWFPLCDFLWMELPDRHAGHLPVCAVEFGDRCLCADPFVKRPRHLGTRCWDACHACCHVYQCSMFPRTAFPPTFSRTLNHMFTLCFEIGGNSASHVVRKTKDDWGLRPQVNLLLLLVVWREQLWKP